MAEALQSREQASFQQDFLEFEKAEKLFDFRHEGIVPWRLMRNFVHRSLLGISVANATVPRSRRAIDALLSSLRFLLILATQGHRTLLVKTSIASLRNPTDQGWMDLFFDDLIEQRPDYFKLQDYNSPFFDAQRKDARFPDHLDPVVFSFWGRILGRLWPAGIDQFSERASRLLFERFGLEIAADQLTMRVSTILWQARLYGCLLRRIRPKIVFVSDTGEFALILAAKQLQIPFVELQHGVFDASHPDAVPGYVFGTAATLLLPDCYAVYGQYWIDRSAGTRQQQGRCAIVGNCQIDKARAEPLGEHKSADVQIVVTSQGIEREEMADWLVRMLKSAPENRSWSLTVKLHPVYDRDPDQFDRLRAHPGVRILSAAEPPFTHQLLRQSDLHLSISSACHYDAAALGVPSVVMPLRQHKEMLPAVDSRAIFLAKAPEDVWQIIEQAGRSVGMSDHYSLPGYASNMVALMDTLIAEHSGDKHVDGIGDPVWKPHG